MFVVLQQSVGLYAQMNSPLYIAVSLPYSSSPLAEANVTINGRGVIYSEQYKVYVMEVPERKYVDIVISYPGTETAHFKHYHRVTTTEGSLLRVELGPPGAQYMYSGSRVYHVQLDKKHIGLTHLGAATGAWRETKELHDLMQKFELDVVVPPVQTFVPSDEDQSNLPGLFVLKKKDNSDIDQDENLISSFIDEGYFPALFLYGNLELMDSWPIEVEFWDSPGEKGIETWASSLKLKILWTDGNRTARVQPLTIPVEIQQWISTMNLIAEHQQTRSIYPLQYMIAR